MIARSLRPTGAGHPGRRSPDICRQIEGHPIDGVGMTLEDGKFRLWSNIPHAHQARHSAENECVAIRRKDGGCGIFGLRQAAELFTRLRIQQAGRLIRTANQYGLAVRGKGYTIYLASIFERSNFPARGSLIQMSRAILIADEDVFGIGRGRVVVLPKQGHIGRKGKR